MLDGAADLRTNQGGRKGAIGVVLFALALAVGVLFIQLMLPGL